MTAASVHECRPTAQNLAAPIQTSHKPTLATLLWDYRSARLYVNFAFPLSFKGFSPIHTNEIGAPSLRPVRSNDQNRNSFPSLSRLSDSVNRFFPTHSTGPSARAGNGAASLTTNSTAFRAALKGVSKFLGRRGSYTAARISTARISGNFQSGGRCVSVLADLSEGIAHPPSLNKPAGRQMQLLAVPCGRAGPESQPLA